MNDKDANSESTGKLDPEHVRLSSIERKLSLLSRIAAIQLLLLAVLVISSLLPNLLLYLQLLAFIAVLGVLVFMFRTRIPGWLGRSSRYLFSLISDPEPDQSRK